MREAHPNRRGLPPRVAYQKKRFQYNLKEDLTMKRKMTMVDKCAIVGAIVVMTVVAAGCVIFGTAAWQAFFGIVLH